MGMGNGEGQWGGAMGRGNGEGKWGGVKRKREGGGGHFSRKTVSIIDACIEYIFFTNVRMILQINVNT